MQPPMQPSSDRSQKSDDDLLIPSALKAAADISIPDVAAELGRCAAELFVLDHIPVAERDPGNRHLLHLCLGNPQEALLAGDDDRLVSFTCWSPSRLSELLAQLHARVPLRRCDLAAFSLEKRRIVVLGGDDRADPLIAAIRRKAPA